MSGAPDTARATARPQPVASAAHITRALLTMSTLAILVVAIGTFLLGYSLLHRQSQQHLRTLTSFVASESGTALEFRDRETAREILASIPAEEGVSRALLRDTDGSVFARYERAPTDWAGHLAPWLGEMQARQEIVDEERLLGSVELSGGTEPLARTLAWLLGWFVFGTLVVACSALWLGRRYARRFTQPIEQLSGVVRKLITDRKFDRRAPPSPLAEVEELRSEFNALLDEIDLRGQLLAQSNARLQRMAYQDTLTGLPNRAMFEPQLHEIIDRCRRDGHRACLFYLDIDSFKSVNDALSHAAGDDLLQHLAAGLRVWRPGETMATRLGGDEFVVLLWPLAGDADVPALVQELHYVLEAPMQHEGFDIQPSTSIGAAVFPDQADTANDLTREADLAMYADKKTRHRLGFATRWTPLGAPQPGAVADGVAE